AEAPSGRRAGRPGPPDGDRRGVLAWTNGRYVVASVPMQRIHNVTQLADLDDDALARCYAYPRQLAGPWLRANFVSSIDGAFAVDGVSKGLGTDADHRVFHVLRELAEVILVGAGTVRAENYGGAHPDPERRRAHFRHGIGGSADGAPPP